MDRRRFTLVLPAVALGGLAAGCATIHPEVWQLGEIGGDSVIYVGTWHARRDEFNEVSSVQVLDQYPAALAGMRKRFGSNAALRKALPTWRDDRARSVRF